MAEAIVFHTSDYYCFERLFYAPNGNNTWTQRGTSGSSIKNCDLLADSFAVGDCLYFCAGSTQGKFKGLKINVGTAIAATSFTGVWEYSRVGAGFYFPVWYPLTGIVDGTGTTGDGTDSFTVAGTNSIEWDLPSDWENYVSAGVSGTTGASWYYRFVVRFRITAVDTPTEGGAIGNVSLFVIDWTVRASGYTSGSPLTMQKLYDADVAGSWGVISKQGSSQYSLACNLHMSDSAGYFSSKNEQITFEHNWQCWFAGTVLLGEISTADKCKNGSNLLFIGENMDHQGSYIGQSTSSKFLNSHIKFQITGAAHGTWGALSQYAGCVIYDCFLENFRHVGTHHSIGVKASNSPWELWDGVKLDCTAYGGQHCFRPTTTNNQYIHRCDLTGATTYCINHYYCGQVANFNFYCVDCDWGVKTDSYKVTFQMYAGTLVDNNAKIWEVASMEIKIVDEANNPISGVSATMVDKNGTTVTMTSNNDGYLGIDSGTITTGAAGTLTDSNKSWTTNGYSFLEVLITSGTGAGQRRIIASNTSTILTIVPDYSPTPATNDKYIIIPYIGYKYYQPTNWISGTFQYATATNLNPFTLTLSKSGYKKYKSILTLTKGLTEIITLEKLKDNNFSSLARVNTR